MRKYSYCTDAVYPIPMHSLLDMTIEIYSSTISWLILDCNTFFGE